MKKLNLKQPKYIFPLVIFLPLTFLVYEISSAFDSGKSSSTKVATDSLNMVLPNAESEEMKNKMAGMEDMNMGVDGYSAVDGLGDDLEKKDSLGHGYTEEEMNQIDRDNAERQAQRKAQEEMERSLAESRRHINAYANSSYGNYPSNASKNFNRGRSRQDELDDYAKELEYIQKRSRAAQRAVEVNTDENPYEKEDYDIPNYTAPSLKRGSEIHTSNIKKRKMTEKPLIVEKVQTQNYDKFNTVASEKNTDAPLIKAMIDKTTKAQEGTRLRFKLLDDVAINNTLLKKGTYLYGLVTGFGQQRVHAQITSILVGSKFIKVNLSVYDNDGMEGFYVPESAFRDMVKEASAQAIQQNMQLGNNTNSTLSGESVALQALQSIYQSATSAFSSNIRKNKARIKYNTIVYLINTSVDE